MEFPHVQAMYRELHPQGVEVIGITDQPRDSMELMLRENKAVLPVAMEDKGYRDTTSVQQRYKAYVKVWFVVDSVRHVIYAGNYNPAKIRSALGTLGAHWEGKAAPRRQTTPPTKP